MGTTINPKTRIEDYVSFRRDESALERRYSDSVQTDFEKLREEKNRLLADYSDRLHTGDMHLFSDIGSYKSFLQHVGLPPDAIDTIIEHEEEHATCARKLGYQVQYGIWWCIGGHAPFVVALGNMPIDHVHQIRSAVSNKSEGDRSFNFMELIGGLAKQ